EVGEACDREGIAEVKATVCADALDACPDQVEAFDIEKVEDSILSELQTELNAPADKTYEDVLAFDAIYSETLSAFYAVPSDETHFKVCGFYSPAIERTNCWLRSTLIVMQSLPLEFKDLGMQKLWLSYKAGYDQCFVDKLVKSAPKSIILPQGGYVADFAYFFLSQCSFKVHANWRCLKCGMELKLQGLDAVFFYGDVVSHMCKCGNSMTLLSADIPYTFDFGVRDDKFCAFYTPRKVFRAACAVDVNDCHSMAVVDGKQIDGKVVTKFNGDKFDFMVGHGMTFSMSPFEIAQLYGSCITPNVCFV
ncbi:protease activity, partial [Murine hepatitis virus]